MRLIAQYGVRPQILIQRLCPAGRYPDVGIHELQHPVAGSSLPSTICAYGDVDLL